VSPRGARPAGAALPEILVSDRGEDVGDALGLIHDGFVAAGYMRPTPSGRRLHPAYLNPGTYFVTVRMQGEPAGAMAMVADGPFGLPSERAFAEEVDAIRAAADAPIHEAGSRVVPASWGHRAGRVSMFMIAAMVNLGIRELAGSPILITIAPEAERSLQATIECERVAGPRPLFGAPALLMLTTTDVLEDRFARALTSSQRTMAALVLDPDPLWLTDRRTGEPLDAPWLGALIAEQGLDARLAAQLEIIGSRHPGVFGSIVDAAGVRIAA
jgi:hypothetical protein